MPFLRSTATLWTIALLATGSRVHAAFVPVYSVDRVDVQRNLQQPVTCGALECLNGGKCGDDHNYEVSKAVCDCSSAILAEGETSLTLKQFVGKTCEIEVSQDEYCAGGSDLFCVNGGNCRLKAENFDDFPCDCTSGYRGRHCEYKEEDVQADCLLTCNNRGKCEHGFNPNSETGANKFIPAEVSMTNNFMHCVCDEGFGGPNCEYDYIKCGGRGQYCFHGSTCVNDACDCTASSVVAGVKLAGDLCEFKATDHCDDPIGLNATLTSFDTALKMSMAQDQVFCVNDGVCFKIRDADEYYCLCGHGYEGKRCEKTLLSEYESPAPSASFTESSAPTSFASVTRQPTTNVPTTLQPSPPTPKPTWAPTPAPIGSSMLQSSYDSNEYDNLASGAKIGVTLLALFAVGVMMAIVIYFQNRSQTIHDATYQGNNGEKDFGENNTQGSQSQDAKMSKATPKQEGTAGTNSGGTALIV